MQFISRFSGTCGVPGSQSLSQPVALILSRTVQQDKREKKVQKTSSYYGDWTRRTEISELLGYRMN